MLLVEELALADLELALVEGEELVDVGAQDVRDGGLDGAVVLQHRHVGGEGALAVGGGVELLDRLLRVGAGGEREDDLGVVAGAVVDVLDGDLLGAGGVLDRGDERLGRLAVGKLRHHDLLVAALLAHLELRAHADAPVAVLVAGAVGEAAGGEVGEELRRRLGVPDDLDLGAQQLDEVVGEDVGRHADGDAVGAEHEEERELAGEQDRLLVAAVVARDVGGRLLVEDLVAREVREAALDVARGGGLVAGVDVAEVALALDEVALVGEVHERAVDRGVAVRVVEHRAPDDGGDLDEAAVVHFGERVQDAALDGLESVLDGRDGAVADRVGGELQEVLVHHARERAAVARGERTLAGGAGAGAAGRRTGGRSVRLVEIVAGGRGRWGLVRVAVGRGRRRGGGALVGRGRRRGVAGAGGGGLEDGARNGHGGGVPVELLLEDALRREVGAVWLLLLAHRGGVRRARTKGGGRRGSGRPRGGGPARSS